MSGGGRLGIGGGGTEGNSSSDDPLSTKLKLVTSLVNTDPGSGSVRNGISLSNFAGGLLPGILLGEVDARGSLFSVDNDAAAGSDDIISGLAPSLSNLGFFRERSSAPVGVLKCDFVTRFSFLFLRRSLNEPITIALLGSLSTELDVTRLLWSETSGAGTGDFSFLPDLAGGVDSGLEVPFISIEWIQEE